MSTEKKKSQLKKIISQEALQTGKIILPDGSVHKDPYYLHIKRALLHPESLYLIGEIMSEYINDKGYLAMAGPTSGSIPIMSAVTLSLYRSGKIVFPFVVRESKPTHGFGYQIDGVVGRKFEKLILIDDVVGTGASINETYMLLKKYDYNPTEALVVVDRGKEHKRHTHLPIKSLFSLKEFLR